ncbi:hypothetical protein [Dietzia maris]|uniref:hypothetical protein n=1 Tax=Dietzia maris TaxID=37915 RepID=UPI0037C78622
MDGHLVVVTPVVTGPDHLGYVTFANRGSVPAIRPVLARVSSVIALILLGHRARDEADNRVRGELLAEVLAPATTTSTPSPGEPPCSGWTWTPTSWRW